MKSDLDGHRDLPPRGSSMSYRNRLTSVLKHTHVKKVSLYKAKDKAKQKRSVIQTCWSLGDEDKAKAKDLKQRPRPWVQGREEVLSGKNRKKAKVLGGKAKNKAKVLGGMAKSKAKVLGSKIKNEDKATGCNTKAKDFGFKTKAKNFGLGGKAKNKT